MELEGAVGDGVVHVFAPLGIIPGGDDMVDLVMTL